MSEPAEIDVNDVIEEMSANHARSLAEIAQLKVLVRNQAKKIKELELKVAPSVTE